MPTRPKLEVRFFRTDAGSEPVREWLKALPRDERKVIGDDISTVQFGWPIGMPLTKALGGGLHEVRSDLSGKRIARVIFVVEGEKAILLQASSRNPGRCLNRIWTLPARG
jgi:phage-related protein